MHYISRDYRYWIIKIVIYSENYIYLQNLFYQQNINKVKA